MFHSLKILFWCPIHHKVGLSGLDKLIWCVIILVIPFQIVRNAIRYFIARKEGEVARVKQSMAALTIWFSVFFFYYGLLHTGGRLPFLVEVGKVYPYNLQLAAMSFFFVSSSVMFAASCIIRAGYQGD